ncbi:hypothetical protein BaRGS_00011895 [Batillaria attramentaria]|uniref:Secreted protein n=1 Tax=Batillaria attramentaria TaxID=370345 RepID=A0ABD0LC98_9CAEN
MCSGCLCCAGVSNRSHPDKEPTFHSLYRFHEGRLLVHVTRLYRASRARKPRPVLSLGLSRHNVTTQAARWRVKRKTRPLTSYGARHSWRHSAKLTPSIWFEFSQALLEIVPLASIRLVYFE